jgi:hypothetical protein
MPPEPEFAGHEYQCFLKGAVIESTLNQSKCEALSPMPSLKKTIVCDVPSQMSGGRVNDDP